MLKLYISFFLIFVCTINISVVHANEPSPEPMLKIETGKHTDVMLDVVVDRYYKFAASISADKTIRIWDITTGALKTIIRCPIGYGLEGIATSISFSPNGKHLAVGGSLGALWDKTWSLYIFDIDSGKMLRRISGLQGPASGLSYSNDGSNLLFMLGDGNGVKFYDTLNYNEIFSINITSRFAYDGKDNLAVISNSGLLQLYKFSANGASIQKFGEAQITDKTVQLRQKGNGLVKVKPHEFIEMSFSPDSQKLAVTFNDIIFVYNAINLSFIYEINWIIETKKEGKVAGIVKCAAWSANSTYLYISGLEFNQIDSTEISNSTDISKWKDGKRVADSEIRIKTGLIKVIPLASENVLVSSTDRWDIFDKSGNPVVSSPFYSSIDGTKINQFLISKDGTSVSFKYGKDETETVLFSMLSGELSFVPSAEKLLPLFPAATRGIEVTNWKDGNQVKINGTSVETLKGHIYYAIAIDAKNESIILGGLARLSRVNKNAEVHWSIELPYLIRHINISRDGNIIVAIGFDGVFHWFAVRDGKEIASLYLSGTSRKWILWTPEGYYDASPGGEDLIGWHLNQGKDKEARFIPSGQLYDVFFRPDIVQAKFRGDDIFSLITITATEALKQPPPIIAFTKAPSSSTSKIEKLCYKVTSTGGGIGEVRVFQNGKLVKSDGFYREAVARKTDEKMQLALLDGSAIYRDLRTVKLAKKDQTTIVASSKGNEYEECQELETMPGENEISVSAFNAPNTVQSNMKTFRFTSDRKPEEPHLYVLGIGIDKYSDPSATLKYAAKDAKDFRAMIQEKAGSLYNQGNIHIESLSDEAASKEGILKAISEMSGKVKMWDSFILFVASHGVLLENQYYIVTAGYNGTASPANLISSNEIVEMSKKIKSLSQLFVFDTCHAGGVDNIVSGLYDSRMSVMAKKMGLHIYASAGSMQEAMDGYKRNGLFTHTLLTSMKDGKKTDSNKDNQVSVIELGQRARQETIDISRTLGHTQSPYIINFGRDNPLFMVQ